MMANLDILHVFNKNIGVNIMVKHSLPITKWVKSLEGEN